MAERMREEIGEAVFEKETGKLLVLQVFVIL